MARNLDFWALPALTLDLVDQGRNPAKRRLTVTGRVDNDQESGSPLVHAAFDPQNDDDDADDDDDDDGDGGGGGGGGDDCEDDEDDDDDDGDDDDAPLSQSTAARDQPP